MTAQEFGEWMVFYQREQLHPAAGRMDRAQQLAAVHNGPLTRRDKQMWRAADFMPLDPWVPQPEPASPTVQQLAAQVEATNREFDT